jgi:hypothetical protein
MTSGRDESTEKEPVMCSKCNEVFETDSKYIQHYNERHKPDEGKLGTNLPYVISERFEEDKISFSIDTARWPVIILAG